MLDVIQPLVSREKKLYSLTRWQVFAVKLVISLVFVKWAPTDFMCLSSYSLTLQHHVPRR